MAPSAPRVSFIIPVRDDARRLQRCLEAIRRDAGRSAVEIIVVDNGSVDHSVEVAREAGARVLPYPKLSVAELRNRGAAVARGDLLAFIDADHEIAAGWTEAAIDSLGLDDVAAAGALCHAPSDGTWVQRMYDALRGRTKGRHDVEWLGSGNMAVRRDAFLLLGGFDTRLETCEDVDLCSRLRQAGMRVIGDERLRSVHFGDPASLRALFAGELWRGRDNLRASLRGPITLRSLPSVVIPIIDVLLVAASLVGVITAPAGGLRVTAAAALVLCSLALMRATRMIHRFGGARPATLVQAFIVASVYDLARALAIVARARHHRRPASVRI